MGLAWPSAPSAKSQGGPMKRWNQGDQRVVAARTISRVSVGFLVVAVGLIGAAAAARADNDCNGDGRAVAITTTWHADIRDIWTGCDSFAIQLRTYAGGSAYNYAYRHVDYPAVNTTYSTSSILGSAPSWRACTYLGSYPTANCTSAQYSWRWSTWYNDTSWKRFD